jgi:ABC transporter with metal-binding/Fe-S-binding domain ATP-binding protein
VGAKTLDAAAVLFTGGKDSVYALHKAIENGVEVKVLVSIIPLYKYSLLYHQPIFRGLVAQAQSLSIPLESMGLLDPSREREALTTLLQRAKSKYGVNMVVTGAVKSVFQYKAFREISRGVGLELYAPNWGVNEEEYMESILRGNIEFSLISITSMGIPHELLGKVFTWRDLDKLVKLSKKYGFNLSFEGGEAETFVTNAPLFKYKLILTGRTIIVSDYEGYYEISRVKLAKKTT